MQIKFIIKNKKNIKIFVTILNSLAISLTCLSMARYNNTYSAQIYPTKTDGAPSFRYNPKYVQKLSIKQEYISEDGNDPYVIDDKVYIPKIYAKGFKQTGIASWYGTKFHNKLTSNKEPYNLYALTAAHRTLPLPSYVKVTNLENHKTLIVRVNDRGPFAKNRIIDLSYAAANILGFANKGTAKVKVETIKPYPKTRKSQKHHNYNNTVRSFTLQFAAFHKKSNAIKFQKKTQTLFKKYGIKFAPRIFIEDNIYTVLGRVKGINQYNKVKKLMSNNKLTPPFIKKINLK